MVWRADISQEHQQASSLLQRPEKEQHLLASASKDRELREMKQQTGQYQAYSNSYFLAFHAVVLKTSKLKCRKNTYEHVCENLCNFPVPDIPGVNSSPSKLF